MRKTILLFICTITITSAWSQFYNTGTDPFSTHWRSINTELFQIIYPQEAEDLAQRYASNLYFLHDDISYTLDHYPKKIDIVLHNQSVKSNGYVVWAPKRMEIVATPPQDNYAHNWIDQLTLHEYRHVVQIDKLNTGFTKGLSYVFGQMGTGAVMSLLPLWYLEGDAVTTETALSNTGRGRDPSFIKEVKAAEMQSSNRFTYDEFYLGSYKNYVPNYYCFGYQMVAWSRNKYGAEIWPNVIEYTGKHPFLITPFYFKLKKETGESKVSLYEHTMDYLHKKWEKEDSLQNNNTSYFSPLKTSYQSNFVSYRYPFLSKNKETLALRTSIDDIARIIEIDSLGDEKTLCKVGYFQGSKVSYTNKYIAWDEYQNDLRWEQRSYSTIRIYNRKTNNSKTLKLKTKHFAPDICRDNKRLVVVKNDQYNKSTLEIWDIEKSNIIEELVPMNNVKLFYPKWLNNDSIAVIYLTEAGKSIQLYSLSNKKWTEIVPPGYENISWLDGNNSDIYFTSTYGGSENTFHVNTNDKFVRCILRSNIGVNFPSFNKEEKKIVFSRYSAKGYKLFTLPSESFLFIPIKSKDTERTMLADAVSNQMKSYKQNSVTSFNTRWKQIHAMLMPDINAQNNFLSNDFKTNRLLKEFEPSSQYVHFKNSDSLGYNNNFFVYPSFKSLSQKYANLQKSISYLLYSYYYKQQLLLINNIKYIAKGENLTIIRSTEPKYTQIPDLYKNLNNTIYEKNKSSVYLDTTSFSNPTSSIIKRFPHFSYYQKQYNKEGNYKYVSLSDSSGNNDFVKILQPYNYELADSVARQERINIQDSLIPQKTFESKKYYQVLHLFNVHSWIAPFYINYDELPDEPINIIPGFTLLSQNALSTVTSTVSYYFQDGYHHFCPGISLRMFYPIISFEWDYGGAPKMNYSLAASGSKPDNIKNYYEITTNISQPLSFSNSRYQLKLIPAIYYTYKNRYIVDSVNRANPDFYYDKNYFSKGYATLDYRFNFYIASSMSDKDLRYPWFFQYYISHLSPILHKLYYSENTVQMAIVQTPGIHRHHSTRVLLGYENGYGRRMSLSRGYSSADLYTTNYNKAYKITLDYALPLLYPNLSLGPVAYFKRVQALLFYDYFKYSFSYNNIRYKTQLKSIGIELGIETNLLRFFWTFIPTIQYSYRLEDGGSSVGFSVDTQYSFSLGEHFR